MVASGRPPDVFARRAAATLFLILAAHSLSETARDSLFLSRLPVSQLPWMYLLVAAASIASARAAASVSRLGPSALPVLLASAAAISIAFWAAASPGSRAFLYLLYLWPAVFSSVIVVEFWRSASDAYTITEAKQMFGKLGASGTAGALTGAATAFVMSPVLQPTDLLPVAAALLLGAVLACPRPPILQAAPAGSTHNAASLTAREVIANRYLQGVAGCLFLATVTATLADFVFKTVVAREMAPAQLVQSFAAVSFAISGMTMLFQVFLVGPLVRSLGVIRSLAVLPSVLALTGVVLAAAGGLLPALLLRITDGSLRYSVHRAASDLLYVPLTPGLRARTKSVIDVVAQRGGQVAGSLAVLGGLALGAPNGAFAAVISLLAVAMVMLALRLRQPYLDLFRATLAREGSDTRLAFPRLDLDSLTALVAAFSSDDEREVVTAMELVAAQGEVRTIPVVMLFHPSHEVVARALDLFEQHQRQGFAWAVDRLRKYSRDPLIKAAALSAYARQCREPSALRASLADDSEVVRMTALVGLAAGGWMVAGDAREALAHAEASASAAGRHALARAIRLQPSSVFEETLVRLAAAGDASVRAQVAAAMARLPSDAYLPSLQAMLSTSSLREAARRALVAAGPSALAFLEAALRRDTTPRRARIHIPRSVSRFPPADALPVLWRQLQSETDEVVHFKVLRGIGRLVADAPHLRPDPAAITLAVRDRSRTGLRLAYWRACLAAAPAESPTASLLLGYLRDTQARTTETIFRLLALHHVDEDLERVFRGFRSNQTSRASGRELIENLLPPPERDAVLALVEGAADGPRLARLLGAPPGMPVDQVVSSILASTRGALRAIALRRAAELGLSPAPWPAASRT